MLAKGTHQTVQMRITRYSDTFLIRHNTSPAMIVSRFGLKHFFFRTSVCKLSFGLAHPILVGMGNLCGQTNAVSD